MGPTAEEGMFITAVARAPSKALDEGKSVCVSSWRRIADSSMPPRVKATGNYLNSRLALLAARADGYDDAFLLNANGTVAEATGSCAYFRVARGRDNAHPEWRTPVYGRAA